MFGFVYSLKVAEAMLSILNCFTIYIIIFFSIQLFVNPSVQLVLFPSFWLIWIVEISWKFHRICLLVFLYLKLPSMICIRFFVLLWKPADVVEDECMYIFDEIAANQFQKNNFYFQYIIENCCIPVRCICFGVDFQIPSLQILCSHLSIAIYAITALYCEPSYCSFCYHYLLLVTTCLCGVAVNSVLKKKVTKDHLCN